MRNLFQSKGSKFCILENSVLFRIFFDTCQAYLSSGNLKIFRFSPLCFWRCQTLMFTNHRFNFLSRSNGTLNLTSKEISDFKRNFRRNNLIFRIWEELELIIISIKTVINIKKFIFTPFRKG